MKSYEELNDYLNKGRNKNERRIPNKRETYVVRRTVDSIAVRYWYTDVITFHRDGRIVLNSGGKETATTKARMNQHLPGHWQVYQEDFVWYLWNHETNENVEFYDGMEVSSD